MDTDCVKDDDDEVKRKKEVNVKLKIVTIKRGFNDNTELSDDYDLLICFDVFSGQRDDVKYIIVKNVTSNTE